MDEQKQIEQRLKADCKSTGQRSWDDKKTIRELGSRLNRIEGQIRGIKKMIEEGVYCDNVLNQIASAQSALYGTAKLLLKMHMQSCIKDQLQAGDDEVIDEIMKTVFRLINRG